MYFRHDVSLSLSLSTFLDGETKNLPILLRVIHVFFTWFTSSNWILFDPLLRVNTNNGHRAKHGSDTGVIDTEGRFVPAKFEEIFAKFDEDKKGGLTFTEGVKMVHALRTACDPIGWGAAIFEWASTYLLVWPQDGIVDKESIRCVFDVRFNLY